MIKLNEEGNLNAGIHLFTLLEIKGNYTYNLTRKKLYKCLINFIDDIKQIGCDTIFLDGSFITSKKIPGDIDVLWDNRGLDLQNVFNLMPILWDRYLLKEKYQADVFPAFIKETVSQKLFIDFFQQDKNTGNPKGIIEIKI